MVIDMQRDFFNDPELARCREDLVAACNRVIMAALRRGLTVVEVRTVHAADRSTWSLNMLDDGSGMTIAGSPGAEPVEGLCTADHSERISSVCKTRDDAFHATELRPLLAREGVNAFLLCGVSTESCIAATATAAYAADLAVGVVLDATASVRPDLHEHALESLSAQYRQPGLYAGDAIAGMADRASRGEDSRRDPGAR